MPHSVEAAPACQSSASAGTDPQVPQDPVAIVDIGSNSVRLVVYSGATRIPSIIFNEKVMAGLGAGVSDSGYMT